MLKRGVKVYGEYSLIEALFARYRDLYQPKCAVCKKKSILLNIAKWGVIASGRN